MRRLIKHILAVLLFVLGTASLQAQSVSVQLVYNNPTDVDASLSNLVKVDELKGAIQSNDHIDQNLIVRIAFFDKNVVGRMMLNAEHKLSVDDYVSEWQKMVENKNAVLFLFVKAFGIDKNTYDFDKMYVSTTLSEAHLLPLVTEFINEHLEGDNNEIISNGTHYLANAITPVWTKEKMTKAEELSQIDKYKSNRINAEFNFSFFDWRSAGNVEISKMKLVTCATDKDLFISDNYFYTSFDNLKGKSFESFEWNVKFSEDVEKGILVIKDVFLLKLLKYFESTNKHNSQKPASEWTWVWNKDDKLPEISDAELNNFIDRKKEDRNVLYVNTEYKNNEGKEINKLHPGYGQTTWCNVFARDLSYQILFPKFHTKEVAPWGRHTRASGIHEAIQYNLNFVPIDKDDAWNYTNKSFVVYVTAYNDSYYKNKDDDHKHPGHIATCYPDEGRNINRVIQGGKTNGLVLWNKNYLLYHLYLGYIIQ